MTDSSDPSPDAYNYWTCLGVVFTTNSSLIFCIGKEMVESAKLSLANESPFLMVSSASTRQLMETVNSYRKETAKVRKM